MSTMTTDPDEPVQPTIYDYLGEGMYESYVEDYETYMGDWVVWAIDRGLLDGPDGHEDIGDIVQGCLSIDPPTSEDDWYAEYLESEQDAHIERTRGPL